MGQSIKVAQRGRNESGAFDSTNAVTSMAGRTNERQENVVIVEINRSPGRSSSVTLWVQANDKTLTDFDTGVDPVQVLYILNVTCLANSETSASGERTDAVD